MRATLKRQWQSLMRARPGTRFQARYRASSLGRKGRSPAVRVVVLFAAALCVIVGIVLVFIPGPAVVFFFLAAGLLAGESRATAGALDRGEVALLRIGLRARASWNQASLPVRVAILVMVTGLAGAAGWAAWRWWATR